MKNIDAYNFNDNTYNEINENNSKQVEIIYGDYEYTFGNYKIVYHSKEHPIMFGSSMLEDNVLFLDTNEFLNNETIQNKVIDICKNIKGPSLVIYSTSIINKDILNTIASNENIKEITLGSNNDPFTLTKDIYELFKKHNKKSVYTDLVSEELKENYEDIISLNASKTLIDKFNYRDLKHESILIITDLKEENIENIKYINPLSDIRINEENIDINLIFQFLLKLKELNHQGIIEIILFSKELFNEKLFKNIDNIDNLNLIIIYEGEKINILKYIKSELKLMKMIEPALKLSPFEKFLYAYNLVKHFKEYKENEINYSESRDLYKVLDNEYMVCVGFSALLLDLLLKLDINCEYRDISVDTVLEDKSFGDKPISNDTLLSKEGHARIVVNLIDPKYNIDGYYVSDPTWDNFLNADLYNHALLTVSEEDSHVRLNYHDYEETDDLIYSLSIEEFYYKLNQYFKNPDVISTLEKYNIIICISDLINNLDPDFYQEIINKFGDISTYINKSHDQLNEIIYFMVKKIISKNNNIISGETLKKGITKLYKDVYKVPDYEEIVDEIFDYNMERQEHRFPKMFKIDKQGNKELILNKTNKFNI